MDWRRGDWGAFRDIIHRVLEVLKDKTELVQ